VEALRTQEIGKRRALVALAFAGVLATAPSCYCTAAPLRRERPMSQVVVGLPRRRLRRRARRVTAWRCPAASWSATAARSRPRPGLDDVPRRRRRARLRRRRRPPLRPRRPPHSHDPSAVADHDDHRRTRPRRRVGQQRNRGATWYDTFPGGCASETLPMAWSSPCATTPPGRPPPVRSTTVKPRTPAGSSTCPSRVHPDRQPQPGRRHRHHLLVTRRDAVTPGHHRPPR